MIYIQEFMSGILKIGWLGLILWLAPVFWICAGIIYFLGLIGGKYATVPIFTTIFYWIVMNDGPTFQRLYYEEFWPKDKILGVFVAAWIGIIIGEIILMAIIDGIRSKIQGK